jgi:serine protease Do
MEGKIVGSDPATDLGVVKIAATGLTPAKWGDADALEVGEWVLAVGSPFGEYDNTVTAGIVSAKNRTNLKQLSSERFEDFIQTDAAINPGNSGGPLVDIEGRVVGINSQIATRAGQSAGVGFSIPSTIARPVMESIIKTGRAQRGWLGLSPLQKNGADVKRDGGIVVGSVQADSPADHAGLHAGDVLKKVGGRSAETWDRVNNTIVFSPPGSSIDLEIVRDDKPLTLRATIEDRVDGITAMVGGKAYKRFGFAVKSLTPQILRERGYDGDAEGVIVTQIDALGPAAQAPIPLRVDDIIVQINRTSTPDAKAFDRVIDDVRRDSVRLGVIRGEQRGFIEVPARGE